MRKLTVTTETAANAEGILDDLYRNAVKLAQNAQGRDEVTDDEVERAFYVLLTELVERDDTREIGMRVIAITAGKVAGLVEVR